VLVRPASSWAESALFHPDAATAVIRWWPGAGAGSLTQVSRISVVGVPSSAASYAAGQDLAPAALRSAGLLGQLTAAGLEVHDDGDLPHQAWSPDRDHPLAQNAGQATMSVQQLADRLGPLLARRHCPGARRELHHRARGSGGAAAPGRRGTGIALPRPSLRPQYPGKHHRRGAGLDGASACACPAGLPGHPGRRVRAAAAARAGQSGLARGRAAAGYAVGARAGRPARLARHHQPALAATALAALSQLPGGPLALHLDVGVLDFIDAPLAENTDCRNTGPTLGQVAEALTAAARDQRMRALSIGELNPTRCAGDPDALPRFVTSIARILAATTH